MKEVVCREMLVLTISISLDESRSKRTSERDLTETPDTVLMALTGRELPPTVSVGVLAAETQRVRNREKQIISLTLRMLRLHSSEHKEAAIFENYLNPVMLVFIGKLSLSTIRWVPMCQGISHFSGFLHNFVMAKLATSSLRVKFMFLKILHYCQDISIYVRPCVHYRCDRVNEEPSDLPLFIQGITPSKDTLYQPIHA